MCQLQNKHTKFKQKKMLDNNSMNNEIAMIVFSAVKDGCRLGHAIHFFFASIPWHPWFE